MQQLIKIVFSSLFFCFFSFELCALPIAQEALEAKDFETATDGRLCPSTDWAISDKGNLKRSQAAMSYAQRERCAEARAALLSRFFEAQARELYELAYAGLSELADAMVLTQILAQVEHLEDGKALLALRLMARICDQSCTPYVAAMLRHPTPELAAEAAQTARILGDPKLIVVLQEVVQSLAMPALRLAAMEAWADIAKEDDYLALLAMLDLGAIDEVTLRIVRSLPQGLRREQASYFARLAEHRALATSVASAYLEAPKPLVDAILKRLRAPLDRSARRQLLRTLALVLPSLGDDTPLVAAELCKHLEALTLLWPPNLDEIGHYALLFAMLDQEDALAWILARSEALKPGDWLEILGRIGAKNASIILSLVEDQRVQAEADETLHFLASLVERRDALGRVFASLLEKSTQAWPALAHQLSQSDDFEIARHGVLALGRLGDDAACARLEAMLEDSDRDLAISAMSALSNCGQWMSKLSRRISKATSDDDFGAVYLARFALWIYLSGLDDVEQASLSWRDQAVAEAYRVIAQPQRRHAEAAFLLLSALSLPAPVLSAEVFAALPRDNKRAYLRALVASQQPNASVQLLEASQDVDPSVASEAFAGLVRVDLFQSKEDIEAVLRAGIDSADVMRSLSAMRAAGILKMVGLKALIKKRLYDVDERLVYGALWALQKLDSLGEIEAVKTIYYRMRSPILKRRLAFLSGLDARFEKLPPSLLGSVYVLGGTNRLQMLTTEGRVHGGELSLLLDDQSLQNTVPNALGIVLYGD